MTTTLLLDNPIRNYEWGSATAIASIQRRPPSGEPEAELWIGTHPAAPSRVISDGGSEPLSDLLAREASSWLGESRNSFGDTLPFLLKILAADQPLSLQVHPHRKRAREVFAAGPQGPYVDSNHKPEVICALSDFVALHGFRGFDESAALLASLGELPRRVQRTKELFTAAPSQAGLRQLLSQLITLTRTDARAVAAAVQTACDHPTHHTVELSGATRRSMQLLCEHYPTDAMVIAPLLLNVVELAPGQALFTDAGTLHSYLCGTGVELMSTSDNVLRAGLTSKPIEPEELLRVTRFEHHPTSLVHQHTAPGSAFSTFDTPATEFQLAALNWAQSRSHSEPDPKEIQVLLCTSGQFSMTSVDADRTAASGSRSMALNSGQAMVIAGNSGAYQLTGQGQLFRATVP